MAMLQLASTADVTPRRIALEVGGLVTYTAAPGELAFDATQSYKCQIARRKQFSLHLPQKNYSATGVVSYAPAKVINATTIECITPPEVTAGNSTLCILKANATMGKKAICGTGPGYEWSPGYFEHFPLFAPAFSRRPYILESTGAVIAQLDLQALVGQQVTFAIEIGNVTFSYPFTVLPTSEFARFEFPLVDLPDDVDVDAKLTLSTHSMKAPHIRRFQRAPSPPLPTSTSNHAQISTFQVDHETKALLKDGIPFIMSGWFAGGYSHER